MRRRLVYQQCCARSMLAVVLLALMLLAATAAVHADEDDPIEVRVGLKMDQIVEVNETSENYTMVGSFQAEWTDLAYAYDPDECNCTIKLFTRDEFSAFLTKQSLLWPVTTLSNQQGRRFPQPDLVVLFPDGRAIYHERFTATFQAPEFDFRAYPFDSQQFRVLVDLLLPEDLYVFRELEGFSAVGDALGEEEWEVTGFDTTIDTQEFGSRFIFSFDADRNQTYYYTRIIVPLGLIVAITWVSFFLKDYTRRIELTGANLLLFIVFNFAVASDLPRLGYLTFIDFMLASIFLISSVTLAFNVILKRLTMTGRGALAKRLDAYTIWLYPLAYAAAIGFGVVVFL